MRGLTVRVAVYPSVLYGEDFIVESIESILPHVDAVYVIMQKRPWGGTDGVLYNGEWIAWPERFDGTRGKLAAMMEPHVRVIEDETFSPWNRWGHAVNDVVRALCDPHEIVLIDPDCVFKKEDAERVFAEWNEHPEYRWAAPGQVELWRTPAWQIQRERQMVSLHRGDLALLSHATESSRPMTHFLATGRVHNLGFAVSEKTMRWKHLCALAFSPVVGESLPNPDWYEKKWLAWHPEVNNHNLEVSIGCESGISKAIPYDVAGLPTSIWRRYDMGEWRTSW